jgi:hypothetical protein
VIRLYTQKMKKKDAKIDDKNPVDNMQNYFS